MIYDRHGNPTTGPRAELRAKARALLGLESCDDEALIAALLIEVVRLRMIYTTDIEHFQPLEMQLDNYPVDEGVTR